MGMMRFASYIHAMGVLGTLSVRNGWTRSGSVY
jgi:hypothetical protein